MPSRTTTRSSSRRKPRLIPPGEQRILGPYTIPHVGERLCRVFLPPRFAERLDATPLLVMFDGQNLFDDGPSYAGGWHIDEAVAKRGAGRKKRAPLVVGIDNGGLQRVRELIPWGRAGESLTEPLLEWIGLKLLHELASRFGVATAVPQVTIGGSSLGGLAALYAHLAHPEWFGGALAMSPSLWVGRGRALSWIETIEKPWTTKIYLDAGGREGDGTMAKLGARCAERLRARGWNDRELCWRLVKSAAHHERFWRRRMPQALRFLYG